MAVPLGMLVHPELLSNEQLIAVIQERHLRVNNLQNMARDELLELFHSYCVPYGQRKYRDKGRGKILNKTRQTSPVTDTKLNTGNGTMYFTANFNQKGGMVWKDDNDRLKPPPDTLAGHMKRIKLATIAVEICDKNLKRKITLGSDIPATDSPPQKKERKPIKWP